MKAAVLLLGSFAVAYNAANLLHELGHALAMWATGGSVERITLHPFSWSYTYYATVPAYPAFTSWAGALTAVAVGSVLVAISWRWRSALALPLFLTGALTGCINGVYFIVDTIMQAGGDGSTLMELGTPAWVMLAAGAGMAAGGLACIMMRLPLLGLRSGDSVATRLLVLGGGLLPYIAAKLTYHVMFNRSELYLWGTYAIIATLGSIAAAFGSWHLQRRFGWARSGDVAEASWPSAIAVLGLGAAIVIAELLWTAS